MSRLEIRFHGRGGQGAVTASKILAEALLSEGRWVQAFASFGGARRGAPVAAFVRTAEKPIRERCLVYEPDYVVVLDASLLQAVNVTDGLKEGGGILVNAAGPPSRSAAAGDDRRNFREGRIDAAGIASSLGVGSKAAPIVNTVMLGAFAKLSGLVGVDALARAADKAVPGTSGENRRAIEAGWRGVVVGLVRGESESAGVRADEDS